MRPIHPMRHYCVTARLTTWEGLDHGYKGFVIEIKLIVAAPWHIFWREREPIHRFGKMVEQNMSSRSADSLTAGVAAC